MTPDDVLDLALGQLEGTRRERVEHDLANDPQGAARADRLAQRLSLLLDDGPGPEPPARLAQRTISRVERQRRWRKVLDLGPRRMPFRLPDAAVAASLFTVGVLTLLPALMRSQQQARTLACVNNLHHIGQGLLGYATAHGFFPSVADDRHVPYPGAYALRIGHGGYLPEVARYLDCPGNGPSGIPRELPAAEEVARLATPEVGQLPCLRRSDYAYQLGHVVDGRLRALPWNVGDGVPLVADGPACDAHGEALTGNSGNHGGGGQNVLFRDGRVEHLRSPRVGPDHDIFHTRSPRLGLPVEPDDHVLAPPHRLISLPE
jgi:hypothetical protein